MNVEQIIELTKDNSIDENYKELLNKIINYSIHSEIESKRFLGNLAKNEIKELFSKINKMSIHDAKNFLFVLIYNYPNRANFSNYEDHEIKDLIKIYLTNSEDPISVFYNVQLFKSNCLLGETYFEWFEDNARLIIFIAANFPIDSQYCFYNIKELKEYVVYSLTYRAFTFSESYVRSWGDDLKDRWKVNFYYQDFNASYNKHTKINAMNRLRKFYFDVETERKQISFLNNLDNEDLDWLMDYLKEKNYLQLINFYRPSNKDEKLALIQASLDMVNPFFTNQYEIYKPNSTKTQPLLFTSLDIKNKQTEVIKPRQILLNQITKAYERRHARVLESESKNNRTEVIDVKNWKKLIKIASHYKLTNRRVINKLIEQEFKKINAES